MAISFCLSVCSSVCSFVCLSPVKFVKSFATWQHLAANGGLAYRLRYTSWAHPIGGPFYTVQVYESSQINAIATDNAASSLMFNSVLQPPRRSHPLPQSDDDDDL